MEDYAANSHLSKRENQQQVETPEKKAEKVVSGQVKIRKKSLFSKFFSEMVQEDGQNIARYIFGDVLIPALKNAIAEGVTGSIRMLLFGEEEYGSKRPIGSKYGYSDVSTRLAKGGSARRNYRSTSAYDFDDAIFDNRGEAEEVLSYLDDMIARYKVATVADFYEAVGVSGNYTDNKYGWADLSTARIVRVYEGYAIRFPKALPID